MLTLTITTKEATELVDITSNLAEAIRKNAWREGVLCIFCPHTTGGITLNENWDADVRHDILLKINEAFANDERFRHLEGNSDAHIKASLFGASETVIVSEGKLQLGKWQGIYFTEWDGAREREVYVQFIPSQPV